MFCQVCQVCFARYENKRFCIILSGFYNPTSIRALKSQKKLLHNLDNIKIRSKFKVWIEGSKENISCSVIWVDPKTVFEPYPNSKNIPFGPQKPKKSKLKVRIEVKIENKSCSAFPLGPKKSQKRPKKHGKDKSMNEVKYLFIQRRCSLNCVPNPNTQN